MKTALVILCLLLTASVLSAQVDTTAKIKAAQAQLVQANLMYYPAKASITNHGSGNDSLYVGLAGFPGAGYWIPVTNASRNYFNTNVVGYWKAQRRAAIDTLNKYKGADK